MKLITLFALVLTLSLNVNSTEQKLKPLSEVEYRNLISSLGEWGFSIEPRWGGVQQYNKSVGFSIGYQLGFNLPLADVTLRKTQNGLEEHTNAGAKLNCMGTLFFDTDAGNKGDEFLKRFKDTIEWYSNQHLEVGCGLRFSFTKNTYSTLDSIASSGKSVFLEVGGHYVKEFDGSDNDYFETGVTALSIGLGVHNEDEGDFQVAYKEYEVEGGEIKQAYIIKVDKHMY